MIFYDGLIFDLQQRGGISTLFEEIISRMPTDSYILEQGRSFPHLRRFRKRRVNTDVFEIFHSTYYTLTNSPVKNITTVHDFVHLKYRGVPPTNGPYENVDVNEFNQFKVTVDLNKMTVRQEIYAPLGKIGQKNRSFDAEEFRCQSLGIDVPEIDVSESITPIGKGI